MKNKYYGLSSMGYVIATFILIGVVMIFSAPMLVDNLKINEIDKTTQKKNENVKNDIVEQFSSKLKRLDERVEDLENNLQNQQSVFDKYVCTIEGSLNAEGNIVSIDNESDRFVFVCEYRK